MDEGQNVSFRRSYVLSRPCSDREDRSPCKGLTGQVCPNEKNNNDGVRQLLGDIFVRSKVLESDARQLMGALVMTTAIIVAVVDARRVLETPSKLTLEAEVGTHDSR